ncbi:MAG: major capsid protein [Magnetococcales bacterium]|nr:major capsid protein [Magnetococcales bacterium]
MPSFDLRSFVTPQLVALLVSLMPKQETYIYDRIFKTRVDHPFAVLGISEILTLVGNAPLVKRGSAAFSLGGGQGGTDYIEPYSADVKTFASAKELNDLKMLPEQARKNWLSGKIRQGRQTIRLTAEALCCQAFAGAIDYPVKLDGGGFEQYQIDFGTPNTYAPEIKWDNANIKLAFVLMDLIEMSAVIKKKSGFGSRISYLAGQNVFLHLASLVMATSSARTKTGSVEARITSQGIEIAGFVIELAQGGYADLVSEGTPHVPSVDANDLVAVAEDAPHTIYYCAIDDLDAGLQPFALFVKTIKKDDPSGYDMIVKSKPVPVPVTKAICRAAVVDGPPTPAT